MAAANLIETSWSFHPRADWEWHCCRVDAVHGEPRQKKDRIMKKITICAALLVGVMAPRLHASDAKKTDEVCSNADLKGAYSFVASGTFGGQPFATAGQTTYDGHGKAGGLIQVSLNGAVTTVREWSGAYTMDAATCTVTKTANIAGGDFPPITFFVTAADDFRELRFIATNQGAAISGTARKR
jgi:hypothetical protein